MNDTKQHTAGPLTTEQKQRWLANGGILFEPDEPPTETDALAECDCCGKTFPADQLVTIPAECAGAAQCDTTACDDCRSGA